MLVSDWMVADPVTVTPGTKLFEAQKLMRDGGFRRLPVVSSGRLVGIVTDRDLREAAPSKATSLSVFELNYLLSRLTVKDVMKTSVLTISPDDPIERAALLMNEHKISGLPVVDAGVVVGILTITDLLQAFVSLLDLQEGGRLTGPPAGVAGI
ncbi:MAG: CBS domain-containing protein [Deinococcales bacterium]|jgi:acetoin utilization protein AcuB